MPAITKQKNVAKPAPKGSVLSEGIDVADIEDDFLKMLLYGRNRVGKTTLACKAKKPLALIALEPNKTGGAKSVKKLEGVTYFRITESDKAIRFAAELKADNPFATVVVDGATSYQDIILMEILGLSEVPEQLNWGMVSRDQYRMRSEKTREALRPFFNLDCDVIVIAQEKDHNPPDKEKPEIIRGFQLESFLAADLGGATVGWLHDACDYIARLTIDKEVVEYRTMLKIGKGPTAKEQEMVQTKETGKLVRRLRTMYHPNMAAGFRSASPDSVPEYILNPDWTKINKVINGVKLGPQDAIYNQ